jgi:hypothetical protein
VALLGIGEVREVSMARVGVDAITAVQGADRAARSYAFLYAAFKQAEVGTSPVRDAVDCLTPFIIPYLMNIAGKQVDVAQLQEFLRASFEFEIPLYAIEQILPSLRDLGHVEWKKNAKIYIAKGGKDEFTVAKEEIETDFDIIVNRLRTYAEGLGATAIVPSGSWDDALINFLKSKPSEGPPKITNVKGVMMNPQHVESTVVAGFIKDIHATAPHHFEMVLKIFMGILIEEFISAISEIGSADALRSLVVFYDTSVLMRILGCSGKLLRVATDELTRYLQDMGIRIYFLSGNETEAQGILDAIITAKNMGGEVYGETAGALSNGEVTIADLRLLQNTLVQHLATKGIFPAEDLEREIMKMSQYQIDERAFADFLAARATREGRVYSVGNRTNDASYLACVVRLRKGFRTLDFAEARVLFVTTNRLFAAAAKRFLIEQGLGRPVDCPPVLNVGQVATIAWLMRDHALESNKAGRELLANCYAAVRPDADWFQNFREAIEKIVGNIDAYVQDPKNNLTIQAARRIAHEESFGNAILVKNLNAAEILHRANEVAEQEKDRIRAEGIARAAAAVEDAKATTRTEVARERRSLDETRARKIAGTIGTLIRIAVIVLFAILAALYDTSALFGGTSYFVSTFQVLFFVPTVLTILDLAGVPVVKTFFAKLEGMIFLSVFRVLHGSPF